MKRLIKVLLFVLFAQSPFAQWVYGGENVPIKEVLDSGMTVILLESHNAPVVTIQAWIRAGNITEEEFIGSGISHFVEHMLFKGTERRGTGQIGREVKEAGGRTNAYTGYDKTVYYITFHSDYFDKSLDIMADVLMHSKFDPEEIERERDVIIKEIKMSRDDPFRRLYLMASQTAYAIHPYRNPVIGYESLLRDLTRDNLLTYYRRLYAPNNMMFIAVGDFNSSEVLPKIREKFRGFRRRSIRPIVVPQEPPQETPRERIEEFGITVAQSMMGFHGPSIHSEDKYPMDVLAIVLGGGDTSRLYRELRERRGIVYEISTWSVTPVDPGIFWIFSSFEPENHEAVKKAIWEQIEKLKLEVVSEKELETARAKVLSNYIFSKESVEGQARSLGSGEFDTHDLHFDKHYVESIGRVTPQEIKKVVEKYFTNENCTVASLVPTGKTPAEGESEEGEGKPGTPRIEKDILPNGLTLLLRNDPDTETVAIRLVTLGGARAEDESNTGTTHLMSKSMLKGTVHRSGEEIASAIESRGGSIRSFAGHNSFGFELDMLSRDAETGLMVLADVIANPSFPSEEVEREKTAALADIKSVDDEIFPSSMKLFRETIFEGHPYGFLAEGRADVVKSVTPEELREFHSQTAVASRMVLSVFGKIDKSRILDIVGREFGRLESGEELRVDSNSGPFPAGIKKAHKPMNKEQLAIIIGFPGVTVDSPERYPLEVLTNLLNNQGGKLFQKLRDERGLAYSVGAFNILGVDPGAFVLYIITVPEKREEAISGVFEVIRALREDGPDVEELERTKIEAMGKHAIGLQTNSQIAIEASFDELYGLGYNNFRDYDSKIRAINAKDIQRVVLKILDLDQYVLVTVGNLESE